MPTVKVAPEQKTRTNPLTGGRKRRKLNLDHDTWHAAFSGGSAVNATSGFTDPVQTDCDRLPELTLGAGGTPGTYTLTGTFDGATVVQTILTAAGATVKGTSPIDVMGSIVGPDPVDTLTLYQGDLWLTPECRCIATGSALADINCMLAGETAYAVSTVPAYTDWIRCVKQIERSLTTLVDAEAIW